MADHNIKHAKTKDALVTYIAELHARMEEVQARVSALRTRHSALELEKSEEELGQVIAKLDSTRATDWTLTLPDELFMNIVHHLPAKYMYQLGKLNHRWASVMKQPLMLKLEKKVRWTSNNLGALKKENFLPNVTSIEKMAYYDDKVYVVHTVDGAKQIVSGNVTIRDAHMTGVFTVHNGDVYYSIMSPSGKNRVVRGALASDDEYDIITCFAVHGEHLFLATERCDVCVLNCHDLKPIARGPSYRVLTKLVSCKDNVVGLFVGHSGRTPTYTIKEGGLVEGYHDFDDTVRFANGAVAHVIDIAASRSGELCVYFESTQHGIIDAFLKIACLKQDGVVFSSETRFTPRHHHHACGMGVTGDYLYVNTSAGDFCIFDLKTMQSVLFNIAPRFKFSSVILMHDYSLLCLLAEDEQIIRFYWDGHTTHDGSAQ